MSAVARPTTTAEGAIGSDRNRSVTPRRTSAATAANVASMPNAIVIAYMPGSRNSR